MNFNHKCQVIFKWKYTTLIYILTKSIIILCTCIKNLIESLIPISCITYAKQLLNMNINIQLIIH